MFMRKIALPILVLFSFLNAHGTVLVALDIDNNFTTSIESGLTINRSSTGGGNLFVSGGTIARGAFDVRGVDANSLQGAIGNNNGASLLAGEIFTFISTITGNIFEAELTFYTRPNQNPLGEIPDSLSAPLGTPPVGECSAYRESNSRAFCCSSWEHGRLSRPTSTSSIILFFI